MKPYQTKTAYVILTAAIIIPFAAAHAIEGPPDTANPPPELLRNQKNLPNQQRQSLPFLGIVSEEVPALLVDHLGLEAGNGVIIRTVCPDSPADKAGLSVNDIILSIADNPIGSPDDVTAEIRKHNIGDRIPLQLIHKGKPSRVEVTLTMRPADDNLALPNHPPLLDGIPEEQAGRLRDLLNQNLKGMNPLFLEGEMLPDAYMNGAFRMLRDHMNEKLHDIPELQTPRGGIQQSTTRIKDDQGSIEMKTIDGKTEVTVRDADNAIVWSGNWTTEEDKNAAPPQIRERIDQIQNDNGFSFRFGIR